eukprot:365661-Chlamydomonas_euryale.AAC.15
MESTVGHGHGLGLSSCLTAGQVIHDRVGAACWHSCLSMRFVGRLGSHRRRTACTLLLGSIIQRHRIEFVSHAGHGQPGAAQQLAIQPRPNPSKLIDW